MTKKRTDFWSKTSLIFWLKSSPAQPSPAGRGRGGSANWGVRFYEKRRLSKSWGGKSLWMKGVTHQHLLIRVVATPTSNMWPTVRCTWLEISAEIFATLADLLPILPSCRVGHLQFLCEGCHPSTILCRQALEQESKMETLRVECNKAAKPIWTNSCR